MANAPFPEIPMRLFGIVLIVLGVIGFVTGGIEYSRRSEVARVGPISATVRERKTVAIPPLVSGVVLLAGVVLVIAGSRRRT